MRASWRAAVHQPLPVVLSITLAYWRIIQAGLFISTFQAPDMRSHVFEMEIQYVTCQF